MAVKRRKVIFDDVLALVLAGGQGERLMPLTRERVKPAVPFGGHYRIIDFTLSNCINSGMRKIYVLTQYKSASLERHLKLGWDPLFSPDLGEWLYTVPPQLRVGRRWYEGTADAVYQNFYLLKLERPSRLVILSGDHIYKMDYSRFVEAHEQSGAVASVGVVEVPIAQASNLGIVSVDQDHRIVGFAEKPAEPQSIPGRPDTALANMGVYCFETEVLFDALATDAAQSSRHDFGHDILPSLIGTGKVFAYPFVDENRSEQSYWRDVGTLDAYYEANMDLIAVNPVFNLYDRHWPVRTMHPQNLPPAKTVFAEAREDGRRGDVLDSLVSGGVIVSGGQVERSILSPWVRINSYASVTDCVLLGGANVGRRARLRRAIVDKAVDIPEGFVAGEDPVEDARRFTVTERGVVIIPRGHNFEEQ